MSDLTLWGGLYAGALLICLWRIGDGLAGIAARAVTRTDTTITVRSRCPHCDAPTPEAPDGE